VGAGFVVGMSFVHVFLERFNLALLHWYCMKNKNRDNGIITSWWRYEGRTEQWSHRERLEIKMWRVGGRVEKFSVAYLRKLKGSWIVVQRWDNAHFGKSGRVISRRAHRHVYGYRGGARYTYLLRGDPGTLLTQGITTMKKRRQQLTEEYFQN